MAECVRRNVPPPVRPERFHVDSNTSPSSATHGLALGSPSAGCGAAPRSRSLAANALRRNPSH
jgi:hypothetical protein